MSEKRTIIIQQGGIYNEHVEKQVFFQGTVVNNMQAPNPGNGQFSNPYNGQANPAGAPQQEQYMKPVEAICAEAEELFPLSAMDSKIFHPSTDLNKLKGCIKRLGIAPTERSKWCVVFLVLRENAIIASDASEQEFILWAKDVFGMTSTDFRHCLEDAKNQSTASWRDYIVPQKYIDLASKVRDIALSHDTILQKDKNGKPLYLDSSFKWSKRN